ncbi:hypothetical protein A6V39_05550 [Candidatus Mycoplasma haematobovis]|uniref:Uncharacterized protein n=1 Tax=Candidatus Mycoplasma haematobovis TaxID=432608 RepID=A0A1A9QCN8_9MOLU|nr:hypothetical protein [Candidatus Mycoplasma haematobovis]OAL09715.1 hypothetical protein A6V39_05550 [Candidatus Mycoplasma haematobovis]
MKDDIEILIEKFLNQEDLGDSHFTARTAVKYACMMWYAFESRKLFPERFNRLGGAVCACMNGRINILTSVKGCLPQEFQDCLEYFERLVSKFGIYFNGKYFRFEGYTPKTFDTFEW